MIIKLSHIITSGVLSAGLLLLNSCNQEQTKNHETQLPRFLEASGLGVIKTVPDQVEFVIEAEATKPRLKDAFEEVAQTINRVDSICRGYVQESWQVRTSHLSSNKAFEWNNRKREFIGYEASQTIEVTLMQMDKFGELTEKVLGSSVSGISDMEFSHSRQDSLRREAELIALADAKATALRMAERLGVELGEVLQVSRNDLPDYDGDFGFRNKGRMGMLLGKASLGLDNVNLAPGLLNYKARSLVRFAIR